MRTCKALGLGIIAFLFPAIASAQMPHAWKACGWPADSTARSGSRPIVTPDTMLAIRQLLTDRKFAELEARLAMYDSAAQADVRNEDAWQAAYRSFRTALPHFTPDFDAWVEHSPDSPYPRIARAYYRLTMNVAAGGMRSGYIVADTGVGRQEHWARRALEDIQTGLQMPEPHSHYFIALALLAQGAGDGTTQRALAEVLERSPLSVVIAEQYARSVRPTWGGHRDTLIAFVTAAQQRAAENPRLRILLGFPAWDDGDGLMRQLDTTGAMHKYDEALTYGDAADFRRDRGTVRHWAHQDKGSIADLDCAIALAPWDAFALELRGLARIRLGASFEGEAALNLQRQGIIDHRLAIALDSTSSTLFPNVAAAVYYMRPELVEEYYGPWRTVWRTLRDVFFGLKGMGVLALVSFANVLAWRRQRFYLPKYVHVLAALAFGLIVWLNWMWVQAGGVFTIRRGIIAVVFPLIVYFVFVTYGGAKVALGVLTRRRNSS